jgi:hypothetical protein
VVSFTATLRNLLPVTAIKEYRGSRGTATFIPNFSILKRDVNFTPRSIYPRQITLVPRTGLDDLEKIKTYCPYRDSNPGSSNLLAIPITLPRHRTVWHCHLGYRTSNCRMADELRWLCMDAVVGQYRFITESAWRYLVKPRILLR